MGDHSAIEWTDSTWNPVTGCTKVSQGCKHCYAERMARRLQAMGVRRYRHGFRLTLQRDVLDLPLHWRDPRKVFVNSMSDLFHQSVPLEYVAEVFKTMKLAHWHTFQILTKRPERLAEISAHLDWPANVWMGTSVESVDHWNRVEILRKVPAAVRFISAEPLLGPFGRQDFSGISWVIVGGESGPGARPTDPQWVREIRDQCFNQNVAFFFKQWGGVNKKAAGRRLDRKLWSEMPSPALAT
ncbi:MAG: phage Gp37/Gp68 family protein [Candidatus Coatesbacteria bacterium]